MAKLRVGIVYGGRSVEHEVSIASATSILRNLDPSRYEVWLVAIAHDGRWRARRARHVARRRDEARRGDAAAVPGARTLMSVASGAPAARST